MRICCVMPFQSWLVCAGGDVWGDTPGSRSAADVCTPHQSTCEAEIPGLQRSTLAAAYRTHWFRSYRAGSESSRSRSTEIPECSSCCNSLPSTWSSQRLFWSCRLLSHPAVRDAGLQDEIGSCRIACIGHNPSGILGCSFASDCLHPWRSSNAFTSFTQHSAVAWETPAASPWCCAMGHPLADDIVCWAKTGWTCFASVLDGFRFGSKKRGQCRPQRSGCNACALPISSSKYREQLCRRFCRHFGFFPQRPTCTGRHFRDSHRGTSAASWRSCFVLSMCLFVHWAVVTLNFSGWKSQRLSCWRFDGFARSILEQTSAAWGHDPPSSAWSHNASGQCMPSRSKRNVGHGHTTADGKHATFRVNKA